MTTTTHEELLDEIVGKQGTSGREIFECELKAEILAYKFKELRKQKKLTQGQLAEKLGVDKGQISRIENGKFNLTLATINKMASELGVRVDFSFQPIELKPVS
jgi:HTH-type transcriptional regulator / antitoxin HipB